VILADHLSGLPKELRDAIEDTYSSVIDHFLREEWDDAQGDAGRFSEAVLRYLEWKTSGKYTPIDGKSKPGRAKVINAAKNDVALPPTLRAQLPLAIELVMDFRNNRNAAHLGSIKPNKMDASCVVQNATWIVGEVVRLESSAESVEVQALLDQLAERHVPLIQHVGGVPVILKADMPAADRALVLLYQHGEALSLATLRTWAEYSHVTRWKEDVIRPLHRAKLVHLSPDGTVNLLRPGELRAQRLLLEAGAVAA
jgi:hypothetical protein